MIWTVKVEQGLIRLPSGLKLPDGSEVQLTVPDLANSQDAGDRRTFGERYSDYIGLANDLPEDLAKNLDQYIHGQKHQS